MWGEKYVNKYRLSNVKVYADVSGTPTLFRDYRIAYRPSDPDCTQAKRCMSQVDTVTECTANDVCFAPTTIEWVDTADSSLGTLLNETILTTSGIGGASGSSTKTRSLWRRCLR